MRTSCNGCRVLRKACNDDCAIRPSLDWIKSPDSQANATFFLAKFYGRAGFLNLVSSAPPALRPAIFKSLLYEACGRIVDPVYGSVGLMWSGQWHHCQAAVDAVMKGLPIMQLPKPNSPAARGPTTVMPLSPTTAALKQCDIRHVSSLGRTRSSKPRGGASGVDELDRSDQDGSMTSNETVEPTLANRADPGLELTLGLGQHEYHHSW